MTPTLQLTSVALRVPDLARSAAFYADRLGFTTVPAPGGTVISAGDGGPPLLTLVEDRSAPPAPADAAGLFHAAVLLPDRAALGAWLRHALAAGVAFEGFADHGISDALYLSDPDGNGLEFYADHPAAGWPRRNGELAMVTRALDLDALLADASTSPAPATARARWGHLHLRVTDLERSAAFYAKALGVTVTQRSFPGARFLAADGYHHHLGLNTWGRPSRPHPAAALGLVEAVFARRGAADSVSLQDPDGIAVRVVPLT